MTVIYFIVLKTSWLHKEEFENALYYLLKDRYNEFFKEDNTKNNELYFGSFAIINESDIFMLLKNIGMDSDLEGQLKPFVRERNRYAHANGALFLTSEELFEEKISEYNSKLEKVFQLIKKDVLSLYVSTLSDFNFYDAEIRAYIDPSQQIQEEFVRKFSLSRIEINWCRKVDISSLSTHPEYEQIKELHIELCKYYKSVIDG